MVAGMNWRTKRTLELVEGGKILDVGCNAGEITAEIAKQTGGEVIGVDILPREVAKARAAHPHLRFEVRDVLKHPFPDNSFDCITFLEVIEHVDSPSAFLECFHRMLKPGGHLIISTPNAGSFMGPLRYFRRIGDKLREIEKEEQNTGTHTDHIYAWDLFLLHRLLYRKGFSYEGHAFAGVSLRNLNLDFLTPLVGRFCTGIIIKVRKA